METGTKLAVVGMSGGVDSSAAALLMKEQGFEVVGVTLHLWDHDEAAARSCCAPEEAADARRTCAALGCRHYTLNRKRLFREAVVCPFAATYEQGGTPNPCVDCNRSVKFPSLYHVMKALGGTALATGHYAQVERSGDRFLLKKGKDRAKDQSYMLYTLSQEQLAHTRLPLGAYTKAEIRALAAEYSLSSAHKPDSQDICFVPDGDYAAFIERYCGKEFPHGEFVTEDGTVLGEHKGLIRYTTGQRKGLGLSLKEPMYVVKKDLEKNQVVLGRNEDLFTTTLEANDLNWISVEKLTEPMRCTAKARYKQKEAKALLEPLDNGNVRLTFDEPQRAITAGQAVVFYDGDTVIGGGKIL